MAITIAKIGRSMKNLAMLLSLLVRLGGHHAARDRSLQSFNDDGLAVVQPLQNDPAVAHALNRIRDTQASDAFAALFTFQTAHLAPAAQVCAARLRILYHGDET